MAISSFSEKVFHSFCGKPGDPLRPSLFQATMPSREETLEPKPEPGTKAGKTPAWRVAFLLLSSACLSGIAVVVWNRQSLRNMRAVRTRPADTPTAEQDEFI